MLIGIFGIVQKYVSYPKLYPIFNKGISSTFGNSNFFGSFISIVLPIASTAYIFTGTKRGFILSLVMFFNMISAGTRSAWVAFALVGLIGLIYLIKQKNKKYFKRAFILFICFITIFIYLLNGFEFIFNKFRDEANQKKPSTSITERKLNTIKKEIEKAAENGISDEMGSGRIAIWKFTLKLIGEKPILGCGPDNLWQGLLENCSEEIHDFLTSKKRAVDKAHNEYLHIAATLGIPALICYLIFIGLIIFPNIKKAMNNKVYFIMVLAIISYLVQAFFNISTIGVAPILWMILGLIDNKKFINNFNNFL